MNLRPLFVALLFPVAACGGAQPTAATAPAANSATTANTDETAVTDGSPETADGSETVNVYGGLVGAPLEGADDPIAAREPAPRAAPRPPEPPIYDRLRDTPGDVPGLPGFSIKHTDDLGHCGSVRIITRRSKQIAPDDQPIAEVFALEFPTGLSFDSAKPKAVETSTATFKAWLDTFQSVGGRALSHYQGQLQSADPAIRARAAARVVQIKFRLASTLGRAAIPADIASGEFAADKVDAYCDALAGQVQSLLTVAESDAKGCASIAAAAGPGWWTTVCRP